MGLCGLFRNIVVNSLAMERGIDDRNGISLKEEFFWVLVPVINVV